MKTKSHRFSRPSASLLVFAIFTDLFLFFACVFLKLQTHHILHPLGISTMAIPKITTLETHPMTDTVRVDISSTLLSFGDKPLLPLQNFVFRKEDLSESGRPRALVVALAAARQKGLTNRTSFLLVADPTTPYLILEQVVLAANQEGYTAIEILLAQPPKENRV